MNEKGTKPLKVFISLIITAVIIIASVGVIFYLIDSKNMITSLVSAHGSAETNATSCDFYVDGEVVDTYNFALYSTYKYFTFSHRVRANEEHEFQVITANGEESQKIKMYTRFGDFNYISDLRIVQAKIVVQINGVNRAGENSNIYFYVDGEYEDQASSIANNTSYHLMAEVSAFELHEFEIRNYRYSSSSDIQLSNKTWMYTENVGFTIEMDFP